MPETVKRPNDSVELRALRDGISVAWQLSRSSAEERAAELRSDGWSVEIVDPREPPSTLTDPMAAVRRRRALGRRMRQRERHHNEVITSANRWVEAAWEHVNRTRIFLDQWTRQSRQTRR